MANPDNCRYDLSFLSPINHQNELKLYNTNFIFLMTVNSIGALIMAKAVSPNMNLNVAQVPCGIKTFKVVIMHHK